MIKKIKADRLEPGMYVEQYDHEEIDSSSTVNSDAEILIDTTKGTETSREVISAEKLEEALLKLEIPAKPLVPKLAFKEELNKAKEIRVGLNRQTKILFRLLNTNKLPKTEEIIQLVDGVLDSLIRNKDVMLSLILIRDLAQYLMHHSVGVCVLATAYAKYLGLEDDIVRQIGTAALLHDIGKTKIDVNIVNKSGPLNLEESNIMEKHVTYTEELLKSMKDISNLALASAVQHHERLDGSGYPKGLTASDISLGGQIIAITDFYDALTSDRIYKKRLEPSQALRYMYGLAGKEFSEDLIQYFIRFMGVYPIGSLVKLRSGLLCVVLETDYKSFNRPLVRKVYDSNKKVPVVPGIINLGATYSAGYGNDIIGIESSEKWDINPTEFLQL